MIDGKAMLMNLSKHGDRIIGGAAMTAGCAVCIWPLHGALSPNVWKALVFIGIFGGIIWGAWIAILQGSRGNTDDAYARAQAFVCIVLLLLACTAFTYKWL